MQFARGTLNGGKTAVTGTPARTQAWDYDAVGNWDGIDVDGTTQSRTANAQNEVTGVSGLTTPGYDANGNMTQAETGLRYVYDAWNRLVAVKNSAGTTTLETNGYDGLNRRVTSNAGGTTTDLYYSTGWQVVEEQVGGVVTERYVWSPVYVDAMVLRDRDTNADGVPDERLWVQQDANWNVTAVADGSGAVVEREVEDSFGAVTFYSSTYTVRSGSSYGWVYAHQGLRWDGTVTLYDNRNRWYSPSLGRFTSLDPIRYTAGDVDLYRYEGNGPVTTVDPSGLQPPSTPFDPNRPLPPWVNGPRCTDARTTSQGGGFNLSLRGFESDPWRDLRQGAQPKPDPVTPNPLLTPQVPYPLEPVQLQRGSPTTDLIIIGVGQPIAGSKPFVTAGSSSGTSIASWVARRAVPWNGPWEAYYAPHVGQGRWVTTRNLGVATARWTPYLGWYLFTFDIADGTPSEGIGRLAGGSGNRGYFRTPEPDMMGETWLFGGVVTEKGDFMDWLLSGLYKYNPNLDGAYGP